jgi:hypothetical protein
MALHFALTEVKEMAPRMRNLKRDSITLFDLARLETCRWKKELKEEMVLILNRSRRYGCSTFIQDQKNLEWGSCSPSNISTL